MTPEVKKAIQVLNDTCNQANVYSKNPYVFAVNNRSSLQNIRGNDALTKFTAGLELEQPKQILSTALRKYVATVSQIVDMNQSELGWLSIWVMISKYTKNFIACKKAQSKWHLSEIFWLLWMKARQTGLKEGLSET